MAENTKRQKTAQKLYKTIFQGIKEYTDSKLNSAKASEIRYRLDDLIKNRNDFLKNQSALEANDDEEFNSEIRSEIDEIYYYARSSMQDRYEELTSKLDIKKPQNVVDLALIPKLPEVSLEKFSGDIKKWKNFIASFNTHIHHNSRLSDLTKFQYLTNSISGSAAKILENLDFVSENYEIALNLLSERFDKPAFIAEEHIKSLFNIRSISSPTSENLLGLLDEVNSHLRSLKTLGRPTDQWDDLIVYLISTKFDPETREKWREVAPVTALPTLLDISNFIKNRSHKIKCKKLDSTSSIQNNSSNHNSITKIKFRKNSHSSFQLTNVYSCSFCKLSGHSIMRCHKFQALSIHDRRKHVSNLKLCMNCLRQSHLIDKCNVKETCRTCQKRHHTLLHLDSNSSDHENSNSKISTIATLEVDKQNIASNNTVTESLTTTSTGSSKYVFLSTALINVVDKYGANILVRALLDSGSQVNLITKSLVSRLGLKVSNSKTFIRGIGSSNGITTPNSAVVNINSNINGYSAKIEAHVIQKIANNQPSINFEPSQWSIPSNIKLADPNFFSSSPIDLLIGNELFPELQSIGQINLGDGLPILQNTILGWVVCGSTTITPPHSETWCNLLENDNSSENLDILIKKFWDIEEIEDSISTPVQNECELHFVQNYAKSENGRFIVKLPFLEPPSVLGNSDSLARRRFLNLENRLDKNIDIRRAYNKFMEDYIRLDHMELVDKIEPIHYYLPHHCVLKPDSSTTKLRVVFDASAKTTSNTSLNQILMNGPVVQNDLFIILLRFRSFAYAISADITKMYRQIHLHHNDQHFQYIFWRFSSSDSLQTYKLKTVTYGTTPASFLATRCLIQLAIENKAKYPYASDTIRNDMYVDDLLTGCNSLNKLITLRKQISEILRSAGFELHKWCTNQLDSIIDIPECDREIKLDINNNQYAKTLGLFWDPQEDNFRINVKFSSNTDKQITKRIIISEVAKIFDPLGLISPIIIQGKILIQKLWQIKVNWDESLPKEIVTNWSNFRQQINILSTLKIPRHIFSHSLSPKGIEIHSFADASEQAYGVAIYVRSINSEMVNMHLLCSKSRVAPLKKITLPRLELAAALLLSKLVSKIKQHLNFEVDHFYYWSDSMIVLHWINSPSSRWKNYVATRVSNIQSICNIRDWRHVSSKNNPADIVSRGLSPNDLINSKLWWHGPPFLHSTNENDWKKPFSLTCSDLPEQKSIKTSCSIELSTSIFDNIQRTRNDFLKLQNVFSYIIRFVKNLKLKKLKDQNPKNSTKLTKGNTTTSIIPKISTEEALCGLNLMLQLLQKESFPSIYNGLKNSKNFVIKDSKLKSLSLFMSDDNLIRVGGRLKNSALTYSSKHPIILPNNHFITETIFLYTHRSHLHVGPQGLLAAIRQSYWPINGRQIAKRICRNCIICCRARPKLLNQRMADLPAERVNESFPFLNTAVDYCGPFYIYLNIRGKPPTKAFLAVFVCCSTKAVHLELASNLSTSSFIGALKRFMSTRGLPRQIISDNGTNFVGANNELNQLYQILNSPTTSEEIQNLCLKDKINWSFIPPGTPHFGGLHEAAVKSTKYHLKRITHNLHLNYEEFSTIIKQVEAVLNSRPLVISDSTEIITPAHFLIHRPLTAVADPYYKNNSFNFSDRWKITKAVYYQFWSSWSNDYIKELQHRYKWCDKTNNIKIGTIVIIKDENLPPLKWKLGKIIAVHPGADGLVRVASIETPSSIFVRGINNLAPLPIDVEPQVIQGGQAVNNKKQ